MPMSQAALDGIAVHGHRWRHHISLADQTQIMGSMGENTSDDEVEACARLIVSQVRAFADGLGRLAHPTAELAVALRYEADKLDDVADCGLDEVRDAMTSLYDEFDFQRICVVS